MNITDVLFWLTFAILAGAIAVIVGNQMLTNMITVNVAFKPG
jgi:hypothetical protein